MALLVFWTWAFVTLFNPPFPQCGPLPLLLRRGIDHESHVSCTQRMHSMALCELQIQTKTPKPPGTGPVQRGPAAKTKYNTPTTPTPAPFKPLC